MNFALVISCASTLLPFKTSYLLFFSTWAGNAKSLAFIPRPQQPTAPSTQLLANVSCNQYLTLLTVTPGRDQLSFRFI